MLGLAPDDRGLLHVGPDLLVAPRIAAIGDITPGPALAHRASAQAHTAAHVLSGQADSFSPLAVPAVVFSDPEIAVTGYTLDEARAAGLRTHLDGARVFNAAVALGVPVARLVQNIDTVTFCLSKGLACPVGSILAGERDYIEEARRWRKMVGGGLRQSGVIAAAGIVALESDRKSTRLNSSHT